MRWGIGEPSSITPLNATTPDDLLVVDALYDSLTSWDDRLEVAPAVATRWLPVGRRTWRFILRRDSTFSDGTPVTAHHFVRTWNELVLRGDAHHHLRDVAGYQQVQRGRSSSLRGVRARDAVTLDVTLSRPVAEFPSVVAHPALAPMIRSSARNQAAFDRPVGNGPFRMAEPWVHGRYVRLVRVAAPPQERAPGIPVQEVLFSISDPASAYIAYEQRGLDVATVPGGALQRARPDGAAARRYQGPGLLTGELASTYFLAANVRRPPFDDRRARRGISLALDRSRIIERAFEGNASPADGLVPPPLPAARQRVCLACTLDRSRARRLLAAAGLRRTQLWVNKGADHEAVARAVRSDLGAVGIDLRIRAVGYERFLAALRTGQPGLFRFGWTLDYPTAENALRPLFHSDALPAAGGANVSRYHDPRVDRLLDRASRVRDPGRRLALLRRVEDRVLRRDQAIIPVAVLRRRTVVSERVRGLTYGPMGTVNLSAVRLVLVDPKPN